MSFNHLVFINKWTRLMQHKQDVVLVENEKLPLNLFLPNLSCIQKIHLIHIIFLLARMTQKIGECFFYNEERT